MKEFSVGFQYVPPEFFSYLMSHLCCMAATFPTDVPIIEMIQMDEAVDVGWVGGSQAMDMNPGLEMWNCATGNLGEALPLDGWVGSLGLTPTFFSAKLKGIWNFSKHTKILVLAGGGSYQQYPLRNSRVVPTPGGQWGPFLANFLNFKC